MDFKPRQPVKHKTKKLHEATFYGWSKSGKRVGVVHNVYYPFGVCWIVDWFKPENIEAI
jgi:hypothetical protein